MNAAEAAGAGPEGTPAGPPAEYRDEVLPTVPSLGGLYARAAARSGRLALRPASGALPGKALRVDGVRGDAAGLSAYQHLIGEPGTDVLPAGYVHVLAFPLAMAVLTDEDFPLPAMGMVHVANRVTQHRPLLLDEAFEVLAWAQEARTHKRGVTVEVVTEVRAEGAVAWRGVSTYLATGRRPEGLELAPAADRPEHPEPPEAATALWRLAPADTARYAEVSGDRNPIHVSRVAARAFGFPRRIAHGMHTAALALAGVPAPLRRGPFTWSVDFAKPVLLPGTVAFRPSPDGSFVAWRHRSGTVHLSGAVRPL